MNNNILDYNLRLQDPALLLEKLLLRPLSGVVWRTSLLGIVQSTSLFWIGQLISLAGVLRILPLSE